jgi:hypothetical protein
VCSLSADSGANDQPSTLLFEHPGVPSWYVALGVGSRHGTPRAALIRSAGLTTLQLQLSNDRLFPTGGASSRYGAPLIGTIASAD